MKKKRVLSLRARVMLIYFSAMALVIAAFYFMNMFFWTRYYIRSSENGLKATYLELAELVRDQNSSVEDLKEVIRRAQVERNTSFALQGNDDWQFMVITDQMVSEYEREFLLERLQENLLNKNPGGVIDVIEKGQYHTLQRVTIEDGGRRYLEIYGYMTDASGTQKKFILSMPLENVFKAYAVSNRYFIIISASALVLGGILILILTNSVTKPIYQLSEISKRMSRLDFSARYTGNKHDEVGELGNNMNEMASQLERTILQLQLANRQLKQDIEEKEQVDEMRKEFISNVSHELKTPIALIQGYAEGLKELEPDETESMNYYTDVILDEAVKMDRMVKKLMTLNQLEFGNEGIEAAPFDIMEMIRSEAEALKPMLKEHEAELAVEGPEQLMLYGDAFKIEEVLSNYLSNALNHLEAPNRIRVFVEEMADFARISVFNTGEAIPEDSLSKVFIKFYKVDKARTRAYGGSGIGLSIVKAIMDAHRKECGVYNTEGGVVFWFELDKAEEESDGGDHGTLAGEA